MRSLHIVFLCIVLTCYADKTGRNRQRERNEEGHKLFSMFGSIRRTVGRKTGKRGEEYNSGKNWKYPDYPEDKIVIEQNLRMESQDEEKQLVEHQIDEMRKLLEKLFEEKQKGLRNKSGMNQYKFRTSTNSGLYPPQHHFHSTF